MKSLFNIQKNNSHDSNGPKLINLLPHQGYSLDEISSADLLVEDFKSSFDNTLTSCGEEMFDDWIHSVKTFEQISNIQKDMKTLGKTDRYKIQYCLNRFAGKQSSGNFLEDIWNGFSADHWIIKNYFLIEALNIISAVVLSLLFPAKFFLFIVLFFVINMAMYILTNRQINNITASLGYFFNLIHTINKIKKRVPDFPELTLIEPDIKKFKRIEKYYVFFKQGIGGPNSGDLASTILDYLRMFFSMELFAFKRIEHRVLENMDEVHNTYLYIGYIDLLLNNLDIMDENETCFSNIREGSIAFSKMNHPLVKNSVSQTKEIDSSFIITGLNMSGKTTFMKSLGLNQILATSFGFAFAEKYECPVVDVVSSISINDELLDGKSRYYAEAERLLKIKEKIQDHRCLCLVDEILSGTNSDERIYGSTQILKDFASFDSFLIAATHDIQIAKNLEGIFTPVYFDGEIIGDKIIFDYIIKDGIVSKRNGLLILKLLGI